MPISKYIVNPDISVLDAIRAIDAGGKKVVFICDDNKKLLGIFTDGDMRRFILKNGDLSQPVINAMNISPVVFYSYDEAKGKMLHEKMVVYPIVDESNRLTNALFWNENPGQDVISEELSNVPLVLMAGGKGTRLYPFTKILPKPLIPIGDYTISERIINNFVSFGCKEVYFILNYRANMIKSYYNEIEKKYSVQYLEEKEFLGTGGGLSLLKGKIKGTFIVSNCDVLINADIECIIKTHREQKNKITFICAMMNHEIPYGVIDLGCDGRIKCMKEKPSFSFLTNTGVYVLEAEVIERLKDDEFIHLPEIAQKYLDEGENVGIFPISEKSWLDMGQFNEMESMMKSLGV
jgi:dTDP-glucose pyrophosphorylase